MKLFNVILVIFAVITIDKCLAAPVDSDPENVENPESSRNQKVNEQQQVNQQQVNVDATRYRKATQQQMYGMFGLQQQPQNPNQNTMMRSAYGGVPSSVPAPGPAISYSYQVPAPTMPCAKNLLLSCQPNVVPVPCGPASGYASGPVGAYSEPVPQWIVPQNANYHTHHQYGY